MSVIYNPGYIAGKEPEKNAVVMAASGEILTYRELESFANRLSRHLSNMGLRRGDHIALLIENRKEFLPIVWGCHYLGLHYTAISTRLKSDEAAYIVNDCGARAFIASATLGDVAAGVLSKSPNVSCGLSIGGDIPKFESIEDSLAHVAQEPLPDRSEGIDMLYSSGTTGRPKGVKVPLPDAPFGSKLGVVSIGEKLFGLNKDCVYLSPAPLYHGAPLRFCMAVQRIGGTVVIIEKFDEEHALEAIEKYKVTTSQWVPTMFVRMLKLPEETKARYDLSSLNFAVHSAAPCPIEVKERMIEWWGSILEEYYSGTEAAGFCYIGSEDWLRHKGSVGRPLSGSVHIVGEDGEELPAGQEGVVYFNSGAAFEYHNDVEKTKASRIRDGWATFGDIGRVDEDGFLYLTDRKAFMIISGGVNIYPQEAENVLTMHPGVFDVAVFGVPNSEFGEEVKAVVQPTSMPDGDDTAAALEKELIAYCRRQLADVKCPRTVEFRRELPRDPTGKLRKQALKSEYWPGNPTQPKSREQDVAAGRGNR